MLISLFFLLTAESVSKLDALEREPQTGTQCIFRMNQHSRKNPDGLDEGCHVRSAVIFLA